jgi:hypothetical protein
MRPEVRARAGSHPAIPGNITFCSPRASPRTAINSEPEVQRVRQLAESSAFCRKRSTGNRCRPFCLSYLRMALAMHTRIPQERGFANPATDDELIKRSNQ